VVRLIAGFAGRKGGVVVEDAGLILASDFTSSSAGRASVSPGRGSDSC